MKIRLTTLLLGGGIALATACAGSPSYAAVLTLTSTAFQDNGVMPAKYACGDKQNPNCVGDNTSPALAWTGAPEGTKSFALLLHDPEGRAPLGVEHMVIYGIPADVTGFAEGELSKPSDKFVGGNSTMKLAIYRGPGTPPNTDWHHYTFTLIATDLDPKALQPGLTRQELTTALGFGPTGHVKATAGLVMRFRHPE